jgi:hypothetical protein
MKNVIKRNNLIINLISLFVFISGITVCEVLFWNSVILDAFYVTPENIGQEFKMPITYILFSVIFVAILFLLLIFGYKLKNKLMLSLSACFQAVLVIGIILFVLFSLGQITNQGLMIASIWVISAVIAPIYGFVWLTGIVSLFVFLILFVLTFVMLFKILKKNQ